MRAALWESTMMVRSVAMPLLLGSTRNKVRPLLSPAAPALRAATIRRSATWPSTTSAFEPESLKPLPERTALSAVCSGRCLAPSSIASAAINSPFEILGRCSDFCAVLPPRDRAEAASTAVDKNGDGIRVRPISSITTPASTQPSALPPNSSGTRSPAKPISANSFQSSREKPAASLASRSCRRCDTGALSEIRPRALSRSIDCSSVRTRAMGDSGNADVVWIDLFELVMAGLVPAIHVFLPRKLQDVDARHKAGHDDGATPPADRGCAWRRCRASPLMCRPRSSWPWCAARRVGVRRRGSARSPIPARRCRPTTSGSRSGAC